MALNAFEQQPLVLMQDNAPAYIAEETVVEMQYRGIKAIQWPPYSPDLNPIETCWDWIKDWLEDRYGDEPKPSYDTLRGWIKEAWEALPDAFWREKLEEMPQRMEAVILAEGKHIPY